MPDRPQDTPTDQVQRMKAQGMSDDKIVETLQQDGYKSSQIFDAMSQADMEPAKEVEEVTEDFPDIMQNVQDESPPPQGPPQPSGPPSTSTNEGVEELVESIIDEKWEEIEENIRKVVQWKKDTEQRIQDMESKINDLEERFDKLHDAVIGKVGEYDKNIMNVGAEIKAMEKAFSKIIPEFANSVSQLTELVEDLKEEKEN